MLVAIERERLPFDVVLGDDDDGAMAAISVAELLVGVERADDAHRGRRAGRVERLIRGLGVEQYDIAVARVHAVLIAVAQQDGRVRGAHDVIIAATARATQRTVVTLDGNGFAGLPGVRVRTP